MTAGAITRVPVVIPPRRTDGPVPLSAAQRDELAAQAATSAHRVLRLRGLLDHLVVQRGLDRLADRHEILRTTFRAGQVVHSRLPVQVEVTDRIAGAVTDPDPRATIRAAADELALPSLGLPSGAGHDAQMIAPVAPVGMIFMPSEGGVSHVPEENTSDDDLVGGACVLLRTALRIGLDDSALAG